MCSCHGIQVWISNLWRNGKIFILKADWKKQSKYSLNIKSYDKLELKQNAGLQPQQLSPLHQRRLAEKVLSGGRQRSNIQKVNAWQWDIRSGQLERSAITECYFLRADNLWCPTPYHAQCFINEKKNVTFSSCTFNLSIDIGDVTIVQLFISWTAKCEGALKGECGTNAHVDWILPYYSCILACVCTIIIHHLLTKILWSTLNQ